MSQTKPLHVLSLKCASYFVIHGELAAYSDIQLDTLPENVYTVGMKLSQDIRNKLKSSFGTCRGRMCRLGCRSTICIKSLNAMEVHEFSTVE